MSHFCHAEPVEACRDIKNLHSPFDGLRVTVVTFYEFIKLNYPYFFTFWLLSLKHAAGSGRKKGANL